MLYILIYTVLYLSQVYMYEDQEQLEDLLFSSQLELYEPVSLCIVSRFPLFDSFQVHVHVVCVCVCVCVCVYTCVCICDAEREVRGGGWKQLWEREMGFYSV